MMSEKKVRPSVTQRIVIKFITNEGVKGREKIKNLSHARRFRSSITSQYIKPARDLIEGDRHLMVAEISDE